jgi:ABC-type antimicrobial peptide transport system permease subunit
VEEKRHDQTYSRLYYNEKVNDLILGRAPQYGEIAISRGLADELLSSFLGYCDSYEDLFDLEIDNGDGNLVGIVDNPHKMVYVDIKTYMEDITSWQDVYTDYVRCYECEKRYDTYEVILGRDLTDADVGTENILISEAYVGYEDLIGEYVDDGNVCGMVVGVYKLKGLSSDPYEHIRHRTHNVGKDNAVYKYSYSAVEYTLEEGRVPVADNECLVSLYSSMQVGDEFDGYTIVGRYNASADVLTAGVMLSTSALSTDYYSTKVFIVDDEEGFLETIGGEFELMSMYEREYVQMRETNDEKMTVFSILGVVCLIAASIMVFFLMRSKMINDIYNIGVYRSLGSSKNKIYAKYFTDTFVMVTFTSLISYVTVMIMYLTAIDSINYSMSTELFNTSLTVPIIGVIVLYAVNVLFGLLPIFTLLNKTPSEILAKYDI